MKTWKPGPTNHDSLVRSYLTLRKAIGVIGTALPFVLAFGGMLVLQRPGIESSISGYYHTAMRDVFVGSLCAIGVFLWSYRGYDERDNIAGNLACIFALGVALFPTTPPAPTAADKLAGVLHYSSAAAFFLTLAYFCLVLFRQTNKPNPARKKVQRNQVYALCGNLILTCIGLIVVVKLVPDSWPIHTYDPVFWLEAAAVVAFGISWLTKGEAILADEPEPVTGTVTVAAT
ncbi:MAG: DUF998 domain-containing protein [Gemmatimonadota bacterium]